MATIRAIYENGVFRPTEDVDLPEHVEVQVVLPNVLPSTLSDHQREIQAILEAGADGDAPTDLAARHDDPFLDDSP